MWMLTIQIRRNMSTVLSPSPATRKQEDHSGRSRQVIHRIQRWATQVEAACRQRYCLAVAGEVNPALSREDRGVHGGEALSVPGARR